MNDNWRKCVLCGDSRNIIKDIPDNAIDLILTDPPYNIGRHSTGNIPLPGRTPINNDVADWDWEDFNPEEWADEFVRILKPEGNLFIFTSYNQLGRWYNCLDHKFYTSNFMVWHKTNPVPKVFKAGFLNSCEIIFTCWNKRHTWNFISQKEMHNFIESPICMRPERLTDPKHPAQKPVSILKKMIEIASNEGDIVFDPFMGVGSVGVAAIRTNRKYIGIDINRTYYSAAKERIENEMMKHDESSHNVLREPATPYGAACEDLNIWHSIARPAGRPVIPTRPTVEEERLLPIIKWAGGKEKELKFIIPNLPPRIDTYYEPFVGGGSVYAAISANKYCVNDLSDELIALYRYIATADAAFFRYAESLCSLWQGAGQFFENNTVPEELYNEFRYNRITATDLAREVARFCHSSGPELERSAGAITELHHGALTAELEKSLVRKMGRMKVLEAQKHALPQEDVRDNIETAVKGAVYMYLRQLYNDARISRDNAALHCAVFLFIRNYCYSGMFRYNGSGEFNVPYGGIGYNAKKLNKKLEYYKTAALQQKMAKTTIENRDFEQFLRSKTPTPTDFVFLDPPYDSEFSTYAGNPFGEADHQRLANYLINHCQAKWMLVIKATDFIYSLYSDKGLNIKSFDKKYLVSFMNRNNKQAEHLLITNY